MLGIEGIHDELCDVASFLQMASGIRRVEYSTWEHESHPGVCESADDFRDEQDTLWGTLTRRLTLFLFAWAAIEAFAGRLQLVEPPKVKGRKTRQIDKLCYFVANHFNGQEPHHYTQCLDCFIKVARVADIGRGAATTTQFPGYITPPSKALYLVYEYRNAFAHGDFSAPHPRGDPDKHPDVLVVTLATRLLLLSIQILALARYPAATLVDIPSHMLFADDGTAPTLDNAFTRLHLKSFDGRNEDA